MATNALSDPEREVLFEDFPALRDHAFTVTSPTTEDYNCFAHTVGRADVWSWPENASHWLPGVLREDSVASLVAGFRLFGYESCESGDYEPETAAFDDCCRTRVDSSAQHVIDFPACLWRRVPGATHQGAG